MFDVAIIGAGITGAMIARNLSAYKLNVCICEKENDVAMGATKANSAIVHAGFDAKEGSLKAKLNILGAGMLKQIASELGVAYRQNGSLVIGFNEEDEKTIETLYKRGVSNGVEKLQTINRDELKKLEKNISDDATCALYAPTGAIICPYELTIALIGNAMDNGTELKLNFEVEKIISNPEYYEIKSEKETVKARYVVNAAGMYADKIAAMIGDNSFKIHPRRGEYILLDKECQNTVSHTVFSIPSKMGKGILITPTVDNNILIGPTSVDICDKEDKSTTESGFTAIIAKAKKNIKNIPFNKTITSFCGLRAVGDTGDFIINSPTKRFVNVAGIESPGLSASPAIAQYSINILQQQGLKLDKKEDYNPIRKSMHAFREMSIKEKNEVIKKHPEYGKIVCRCEKVTEGEILDAIRQNPKAHDLDGVKRRTRAQMGRCQGGFCMPHIIELLAREQKIKYEEVTKFGKTSFVNLGKTKGGNLK